MRRLVGLAIVIFFVLSCTSPTVEQEVKTTSNKSDSIIVAQLISKSKETYTSNTSETQPFDDFLKEAEELAAKSEIDNCLFEIYNLISRRWRNKSYYANAMEYQQNALEIAEKLEDPKLLAESYNQMGTIYRRVDENSKALDMHMKALFIAENNKDTFHISSAINGMGNVSNNLNRNLAAIEYFQRSLSLSKKMNNTLGLAINTNNIGDVYLKLNQTDSALHYAFASLDYNNQLHSAIGKAICHNSIGKIYRQKKQYSLALEHLFKALESNLASEDVMNTALSYSNIGKTYLEDNHPELAITYLQKALSNAKEIGSKYAAEKAAQWLSEAYEQKGLSKEALKYHKLSTVYRDSTINEKNIFNISMAESNYLDLARKLKVEELSKQTLLQQSKIDQQNIYILIVIIAAIILLMLAFLLMYQFKLRNRYRTLKFQQRLLRTQMNPHFIFNALSAIQVFILENDMTKSSRFLSDFSKLMRQVLRSSNYEYISISEEIEILQYYLNLQQLRFSPPFEYRMNIEEELKDTDALVPPMLIQPIVENAIEHGLKPVGKGGEITINFKQNDYGIVIEIEDNGLGIDYTNKSHSNGKMHDSMALKITKERLHIIEKDTNKKTKFEIYDKRTKGVGTNLQGTVARFEIPIITTRS